LNIFSKLLAIFEQTDYLPEQNIRLNLAGGATAGEVGSAPAPSAVLGERGVQDGYAVQLHIR
jgi:hypothetical protein